MDNFDVIMAVIVGVLIIAAIIVFWLSMKNSNTRKESPVRKVPGILCCNFTDSS